MNYEYKEGKTDFLVDEVQYIVDHYCYTFTIPRISWHADIATLERAMWFFGYKGYRYHDKDIQTGFVYFKNPEAELTKTLAQEASNFGFDTSTEIVKTEIDRKFNTNEILKAQSETFNPQPLPAPSHTDLMVPPEDIPDQDWFQESDAIDVIATLNNAELYCEARYLAEAISRLRKLKLQMNNG